MIYISGPPSLSWEFATAVTKLIRLDMWRKSFVRFWGCFPRPFEMQPWAGDRTWLTISYYLDMLRKSACQAIFCSCQSHMSVKWELPGYTHAKFGVSFCFPSLPYDLIIFPAPFPNRVSLRHSPFGGGSKLRVRNNAEHNAIVATIDCGSKRMILKTPVSTLSSLSPLPPSGELCKIRKLFFARFRRFDDRSFAGDCVATQHAASLCKKKDIRRGSECKKSTQGKSARPSYLIFIRRGV